MDKNNSGEYLAPVTKVVIIGLRQTLLLEGSQNSAIEQSLENEEVDW